MKVGEIDVPVTSYYTNIDCGTVGETTIGGWDAYKGLKQGDAVTVQLRTGVRIYDKDVQAPFIEVESWSK